MTIRDTRALLITSVYLLPSATMSDSKALPTEADISKAFELEILDVNGGKVAFGLLFESEKAIVVFIR